MANSKISALTSAATVAGTEVLPIVQSSATVKVAISDLNPGLSTILATKGGTGQTSYAVGDLLYASTTTALSKLADVATGNALISGGVGVAPSYGKIGLTTHVSGTLPVANGGTNLTSFTSGGVVYASSTSAVTTGSALNYNGTTLKVASAASAIDIGLTGDTTYHYVRTIDNAGQSIYFGNDNAAGSFFGAGAYGRVIYSEGSNPISIYTNATKRVTIGATGDVTVNTGNVVQGTAAKGFDFSANTPLAGKTSTILNWYEEGTWTPNQGAGLTLVGAFSSTGKYTRIGRQVSISGTVTGATSVAVTAAGVVTSNLPFTVGTAGHGNATNAAVTASATVICTGTSVTSAAAIAATATITFSATYFV